GGPVDDAELRVEHPLPGEDAQRDRERPGEHEEPSDHLAGGERPEQEEGEGGAEDALRDPRAERKDEGVAERELEDRVADDRSEVLQPDETAHGLLDRRGAQAEIDRKEERVAYQRGHEEDGGGDE